MDEEDVEYFRPVVDALLSDGWGDVTFTCGGAPVQAEGHLPDGREFYFRSRHQAARLDVPFGVTLAEWRDPRWERDGASALTAGETLAVMRLLYTMVQEPVHA